MHINDVESILKETFCGQKGNQYEIKKYNDGICCQSDFVLLFEGGEYAYIKFDETGKMSRKAMGVQEDKMGASQFYIVVRDTDDFIPISLSCTVYPKNDRGSSFTCDTSEILDRLKSYRNSSLKSLSLDALCGFFEKTYIFTRYPIITVDLLTGIKGITRDDCSFYRGELTVDWRVPVGVIGYGNLHLNGGAILGSVPYPLLKLHEGNETYFLDKTGFSLMNYYEYASDRWVTAFYEHNFNGLILGNLPLIKRLNLREVVTFRGAWGTLSEQNRSQAPFLLPEGMSSLEKPYAEAGVGITNIFRMLRVDCFWRLTHRTERPDRNFAVTLGLDLEF